MDTLEPLLPKSLFPSQRESIRNAIEQKEDNWYQLIMKIMTDINPEVRDDLLKTFVIDANLLAWTQQEKSRKKYECNIPWAILLDPTSACNLHCTGCWAADYGNALNLSYDDIDSIITQGKELGVHIYIYTGGEPLVRKKNTHQALRSSSRLCVPLLHERNAHRRRVLPGDDPRQEFRSCYLGGRR